MKEGSIRELPAVESLHCPGSHQWSMGLGLSFLGLCRDRNFAQKKPTKKRLEKQQVFFLRCGHREHRDTEKSAQIPVAHTWPEKTGKNFTLIFPLK
ncbi:MAG TPA: hypothetical protein VK658_09680 [Chryseolinea sp.]|nr:hypothetical protein [Chryseolinea sp.]